MNYTFQSIDDWEHNSALKITNFQESVKMSTYLVCFIVCDFKYLERTTKFGTKVTYTRYFHYNLTSPCTMTFEWLNNMQRYRQNKEGKLSITLLNTYFANFWI